MDHFYDYNNNINNFNGGNYMKRISKITGKVLDYKLIKKYKDFNLYEIYRKDKFLYRTCEKE